MKPLTTQLALFRPPASPQIPLPEPVAATASELLAALLLSVFTMAMDKQTNPEGGTHE
jgi:hypothetical protein